MHLADENLRKRRVGAGTIVHRLSDLRVFARIVLGECSLFAIQQRLGGAAIAAARTGIDFDGKAFAHVLLCSVECSDYMGALGPSTTRANTSTSTCAAWARSSARAQAASGAPEVRTLSISTRRRPAISPPRVRGYLECALHIARPLRPRKSDLLLGRPHAPQHVSAQGDA